MLDFPASEPEIISKSGNITGWQELTFSVMLNNCSRSLKVNLQYNGFEGNNANSFRSLLKYIFEIADIPEAEFIVERLLY